MRRDGRSGKPCRENVDAIKPVINAYKIRANERRAKAAAIQRERYHFLRAHGLCVRCGQAEAISGNTLCHHCHELRLNRKTIGVWDDVDKDQRRSFQAKRKAHGLCVRCGKHLAEKGKTRCVECNLYQNQIQSGSRMAPKSLMPERWMKKLLKRPRDFHGRWCVKVKKRSRP